MTDVLVLSGSLRAGAVTTQIASVALAPDVPGVATALAGDLDAVPLFNADLDTVRPPAPVAALRRRVAAADALLLVSPSNNGSVSAVLKNAVDWLSRPRGFAALQGKPAALLVTGYSVGSVEAHLDHVLAVAGARVVRSAGRALSLRLLDGKRPADAPAVREAVRAALVALHDEAGRRAGRSA
jgi:NAD(P)H-dependent FMN reductase